METRTALRAQKSQYRRQQNLAMKIRRSVKGHIPRSTIRRNEQEVTSNTKNAQRATNVRSRVPEVTKFETSKINHEVVNVTRSKTSVSQQESSVAKLYRGQVVTTVEPSTDGSHTRASHADSSHQAAM